MHGYTWQFPKIQGSQNRPKSTVKSLLLDPKMVPPSFGKSKTLRVTTFPCKKTSNQCRPISSLVSVTSPRTHWGLGFGGLAEVLGTMTYHWAAAKDNHYSRPPKMRTSKPIKNHHPHHLLLLLRILDSGELKMSREPATTSPKGRNRNV